MFGVTNLSFESRRTRRTVLAVTLAVASPAVACAQSTAGAADAMESAATSIDAYLTDLAHQGFDGVLLLQGDGSVWLHKGYGSRDCQGTAPMTINAIFDIGSITKTVTAAAILRLLDDGALSLDDRLGDLLPDVPPDRASVTVEQLLRHSSGFPEFLGADEEYIDRTSFLQQAMAAPLEFQPGTDELYSNVGYSLLAAIIETSTARRYGDWVAEHVLRPGTSLPFGYELTGTDPSDLACGMLHGERWGTVADYFGPDEPSWYLLGNGGLMTTAAGLDAWFRSLMEGQLLSAPVTDIYLESVIHESRTGGDVVATSGANLIFSSQYVHWFANDLSLVLLTSDGDWPKERVMPDILDRLRPALEDAGGSAAGDRSR